MMASQHSHRPSTHHSMSFARWTGSLMQMGEDGHGQPAEFVPPCDLVSYWTHRRVERLLKDYRAVGAKIDTILSTHIRVFSILVFTHHLDWLSEFMEHGLNDSSLPLTQRPFGWPENSHVDVVFEDFQRCQWKFCPLEVSRHSLVGQRLDNRCILPISSKKVLRQLHGESEVIQADFHTNCIDRLPTTMVLKVYTSLELYKAEVNAFTMIYNSASNEEILKLDNIIEFYGHFAQNNKYYLLLEFAEQGNLDSYFKNTKPPESASEMVQFWKSMFKLFQGLILIHNLGGIDEESTTAFRGSHQDIKPGNIFVTFKKPSNRYDVVFKIADFGMSDFWQVSHEDPHALGVDNKGDQWYCAPECIANHEVLYRFDNRVGSEVDIWSLGCVFSEAAVWAVCGQPGLRDYLERRLQETQRVPSMARSGFAGCFHNGSEPLEAVALMHTHVQNRKRHWDTVTPEVIRLIHESMLLEPMGPRRSARDLLQKSERLLQDAENKAVEEGHIRQATSLLASLVSPPSPNKVTVEEVQQYRNDMKKHRPPNEYVATQCSLLQEKIQGRDQIFLIDDSASMKTQHRENVLNTFIALSYLAKRIDEDGLDLFFTSHPAKRHHQRQTTKLLHEVQQHFIRNPSSGTSSMEASMSMVIDYIIGKLPNPHVTLTGLPGVPRWLKQKPRITLIVFTDGQWGNGSAFINGVEKEIARLIRNVKERNLSRTSVTIQFIRFGDDPESISRLNYLDKFGKDIDWDIVDTKSHKDHVPDMFIGSIDDIVDDKDEE
ncbi:kinase-like domain-containing protein [Hypoxylon sp. FL0543]|nr:kinase-like domain-containing protein [Hypoxylon sp. FL0543]